MVDKIFENLSIPYKETRFLKVPKGTYAIFSDSYESYGGDTKSFFKNHQIFIELYSDFIDEENEKKIEEAMSNLLISFNKSERVWLDDEEKYQVIYDFKFIERRNFNER